MIRPVAGEDHFGTSEIEEDQIRPRPRPFHRSASVTPIQYLKHNLEAKSARTEGRNGQIHKYTWRHKHSSQELIK